MKPILLLCLISLVALNACSNDTANSDRNPIQQLDAGREDASTDATQARDVGAPDSTIARDIISNDAVFGDTDSTHEDTADAIEEVEEVEEAAADSTAQPDVSEPAAPHFGFPVYTRAEIDAWSTNSPEYTRLANSWAGNVNRVYASYGSEISNDERDLLRDEAVYLKVQAVLWAADGNPARRAKIVERLDALRGVTSWQWDAVEQYRLVAGWACTNLAQAAAIIDYQDPEFKRFLTDVSYPLLDWTAGPNWHASFADSRLAIAAYVKDATLWEDAKDYFYARIAQSFYHSAYDHGYVKPLFADNGNPSIARTKQHWGGNWGAAQINDDYSPVDPSDFPDGTNAERMRDLGHVSMSTGAWMHGARTILAQGEVLEPQAYDRLREGYAYHGARALEFLNTGTIPPPVPVRGDGGGAIQTGWFGARVLFGADTPAVVLTLCEHPTVTGASAAGSNHLVAEAFADGI